VDSGIGRSPISVPHVRQTFGFATHVRQTLAIAWSSFRMIARSPAGLFLLAAIPMGLVLLIPMESQHWDVPLLPRTDYVITKHLTAPLTYPSNYWVIIPLLIVFYAGELVWRERDAGLSENVDAMPVPEWVLFLGKFLGLGLVLASLMVILTAVGMLAQTLMGYHDFQARRYLQILLGLQLPEYLLFAALAFSVQAVVNQKHLAMLVALIAYFCMVFSPVLGIEHNLLVYGAGPGWSYTEMRGFGPSSARGVGSSSTGQHGRCCSRRWRGCSGCVAGNRASAIGCRWRGAASRVRRPALS
jgi:ABC-type transport system involved in multi-copper enzyme maturation permease subunit